MAGDAIEQGTEAMKHTVLAGGLIVLLGTATLGCKTTPKLSWWKKDKAAEDTALAQKAPPLPSEIAKQAESGKASSAQLAGGDASPFKSTASIKTSSAASTSATGGGYPSTSAPAFNPGAAAQLASAGSAGGSQVSSANLGSISMPYNPSAAPAMKAASSTEAAAAEDAGRYSNSLLASGTSAANSMLPPYGQAAGGAVNTASNLASSAPAYGSSAANAANQQLGAAGTTANAAATNVANNMTSAVNNLANSITPYSQGQYGSSMTAPPATAPAVGAAGQPAVSAAASTAVAAGQPWRPGGTSSYPTTGAASVTPGAVEVATRPDAPATGVSTSAPASGGTTSPVISMPSSRY
jgi:hypothetical protein